MALWGFDFPGDFLGMSDLQVESPENWCYGHCTYHQNVELWVISFLEIGHIFPLIVVDINELLYLCRSKRVVYRPCHNYC